MEHTGKGNNFELVQTVKMETRHPIERSFGEFPLIYIISAELWTSEVTRH